MQLAGTLFNRNPRLISIDDVLLEAELSPHMLFVRNNDKPGFVGRLGEALGAAGVNIANFNLGRKGKEGADAVCLVAVDGDIPAAVMDKIRKLPNVISVQALRF